MGETTPALSDTIRVNESIAQDVTKQVDGNTIRYNYKYDGYSFHVDAEVDAVQTHNAQEAIKSAWGGGELGYESLRGSDSYCFTFSDDWLKKHGDLFLSDDLNNYPGQQYTCLLYTSRCV